jgi:hypothetical protein
MENTGKFFGSLPRSSKIEIGLGRSQKIKKRILRRRSNIDLLINLMM